MCAWRIALLCLHAERDQRFVKWYYLSRQSFQTAAQKPPTEDAFDLKRLPDPARQMR